MKMYKIMRVRSDGMLYSIGVNRNKPYDIDEWYTAEHIVSRKYKTKKGFYGFEKPDNERYKTTLQRGDRRIWVECEVEDYEFYHHVMDGATWVIAQRMRMIRALSDRDVAKIISG